MIFLKKTSALLLFFMLCSMQISAQTVSPQLCTEVRFHYGDIVRHHKDIHALAGDPFYMYQMSLILKDQSSKEWHYNYNHPSLGLSFLYAPITKKEYLGHAYSIFPHIDFHLLRKKKSSMQFRLGTGFSWLTNKFDSTDNPLNTAIGSNLNGTIQLMLIYDYKLNKNILITAGGGITHFSNGVVRMPNLGINIPGFNLGFAYRIKPLKSIPQEEFSLMDSTYKKGFVDFHLGAGIKEEYPVNGPKYFTTSMALGYYYRYRPKHAFGIAADLFYDQSFRRGEGKATTEIQKMHGGFSANYELFVSKLSLHFSVGYYVYNLHNYDGNIYDMLAFKYYLNTNQYLRFTMKTHFFRADFLELGYGLKL